MMIEPTTEQKREVATAAGILEELPIMEYIPGDPDGRERDTGERMEFITQGTPLDEWSPHEDWMDAAPLLPWCLNNGRNFSFGIDE